MKTNRVPLSPNQAPLSPQKTVTAGNTFLRFHTAAALLLAIILFSAGTALITGNDGRDRYAGAYPNELWLFPDSPALMAGYRVLEKDGPGGADGDRTFRWAQAHAIALVRVAAYETQDKLGKCKFPMPIFDLSAENGDTPVGFEPGKPPRGRHPGGSHDGGINMDLGYYLTSLEGLHFSPDHSACSDHFKENPKEKGKPKDAYICNGPPDRLDVKRQSFFMLQLVQINRELFKGALLEQIGMDWKIQLAIMKQLKKWKSQKQFGVSTRDIDGMERLCTADSFDGWAYSHHHHIHLRLTGISVYGKYGSAFQRLFQRERDLDRKLPAAGAEPGTPLLRARVYSYRMGRSVEAELLNDISPKTRVKFRVNDGPWVTADPAYWSRTRAMLPLPFAPGQDKSTVTVEAQTNHPKSGRKTASTTLHLPRQEPHLFVAVDPGKITGDVREVTRDGRNTLRFKLSVPPAYRAYITGISFEIFRKKENKVIKEKYDGSMEDFSYNLRVDKKDGIITMARARLLLSSRMTLLFPLYIQPKK